MTRWNHRCIFGWMMETRGLVWRNSWQSFNVCLYGRTTRLGECMHCPWWTIWHLINCWGMLVHNEGWGNSFCGSCSMLAHSVSQKRPWRIHKAIVGYKCNGNNHVAKYCQDKDGKPQICCYLCNKLGYISWDCPRNETGNKMSLPVSLSQKLWKSRSLL